MIESGRIVTAYHAIWKSSRIRIVIKGHPPKRDVAIEALDPRHDLALLKPLGSGSLGRPFRFRRQRRSLQPRVDSVLLAGNPRGMDSHQFWGTVSKDGGYTRASTLNKSRNKAIFPGRHDLDLLSLDITAYEGSSGAPVLHDGEVVGVFSGSFSEGRGLGWAIPSEHITELLSGRRSPRSPSEISDSEWTQPVFDPALSRSTTERLRHHPGHERLSGSLETLPSKFDQAYRQFDVLLQELSGELLLLEADLGRVREESANRRARLMPALKKRLLGMDDSLSDFADFYHQIVGLQDEREAAIDEAGAVLVVVAEQVDNEKAYAEALVKVESISASRERADETIDILFLSLVDARVELSRAIALSGAGNRRSKEISRSLQVSNRAIELLKAFSERASSSTVRREQKVQVQRYLDLADLASLILYQGVE
ncbi:MAG: serine protease [Deltaproteobacteria bacterium]|nr:serine protease [Deltaproteobacteria bacterium]